MLDHLAHVALRLGSGLGDRGRHQAVQLGVRQLGRKVGLDDLGLALLALRQVLPRRPAVGLGRLTAPLALAPQDRQLVGVAVLLRLL